MYAVHCPVCKGLLELSKPVLGQEVECLECGEVFKVVKLDPLQLTYLYDPEDEPLLEEEHRFSHLD